MQADQKGVKLIIIDENGIKTMLKGCYIEADKFKLSQVIRNFVSNAIKFTPAGGSIFVRAYVRNNTYNITDRLLPVNKSLRVEVQDSGIGIAQVSG